MKYPNLRVVKAADKTYRINLDAVAYIATDTDEAAHDSVLIAFSGGPQLRLTLTVEELKSFLHSLQPVPAVAAMIRRYDRPQSSSSGVRQTEATRRLRAY